MELLFGIGFFVTAGLLLYELREVNKKLDRDQEQHKLVMLLLGKWVDERAARAIAEDERQTMSMGLDLGFLTLWDRFRRSS